MAMDKEEALRVLRKAKNHFQMPMKAKMYAVIEWIEKDVGKH